MDHTKNFKNISSDDVDQAGGKGASLGEMTQAGIAVPPGYVVLASAFDRFLEETDLGIEIQATLDTVNVDAVHTIDEASERIQGLILSAVMPDDIKQEVQSQFDQLGADYVAVRSSATAEDSASAAWAGQLDTFLNTTQESLLKNVQKCWASLFTPRAIFYRFEQGLENHHISVAVVVQKMIQSETSGIAFSVHPVTQDRNQMIIEAGFGLGEAIVSGSVTPDAYVIKKDTLEIIDVNVNVQNKKFVLGSDPLHLPLRKGEGRKAKSPLLTKEGQGEVSRSNNHWIELSSDEAKAQVLSEPQITELAKLILKIENHYNFPCDIEWAFENGEFYITQSRPITTLDVKLKDKYNKESAREYSLFRGCAFSKAIGSNAQEIMGHAVNDFCAVYRGGDLVTVYYKDEALKPLFQAVLKNCQNIDEVKKTINTFLSGFEKLKEYYSGAKKIKSNEDLKEFYDFYAMIWSYIGVIFIIPALDVDEGLKKAALDAREATQEYNEVPEEIFKDFIHEHYPQLDEYSRFILPDEIWNGDIEKLDYIERLKERAPGYIYMHGKVHIGDLDKVLDELNIELNDQDSFISGKSEVGEGEFRGKIANKGKVRGTVRIVSSTKDLDRVKDGDILVAAMTMPKYITAMKRAAAFVTDEGGLMCHAAIVSREMGKPCIIGTNVATQMLKDGDLVEVDADNGVVRILKKDNLFILDEIKNNIFEKEIAFPFIPVLFFEASLRAYSGNIIAKKYNIEGGTVGVVVMTDVYEGWMDHSTKYHVDDPQVARQIIKENISYRDENIDYLKSFLAQNLGTDREILSSHIDRLNEILEGTYQRFIYFSDEAFDVIEPELLEELQKARLEISESIIETLWQCFTYLLDAIKDVTNIPRDLLDRATSQELHDILSDVDIDKDQKYLKNRPIAFVGINNVLKVFTGSEAIEIQSFLIEQSPAKDLVRKAKTEAVIHGVVARKGKGKGRVIKLLEKDYENYKSILRNKTDYILVTPMTRPEFTPYLKDSIAIVTDEGGITCHAAIIARELGKPCIIGTKVATQVFKDGDMVEVDADEGVVRILKKDQIDIDDYQRLFRVVAGAVAFHVSDVFRRYYETLQTVLTVKDGVWTSYIPIKVRDKLLKEGIGLYSSRVAFDEYRDSFQDYIKLSNKFFDGVLNKRELLIEDAKKAYEMTDELFSFYSKTEFFYTDEVYKLSLKENNAELNANLDQLDDVKNRGREHLNRIFFGGDGFITRMADKVGRQFGVNEEDINLYKVQEVIELFDGKKVEKDELMKRSDSFVTVSNGINTKYLTGVEAKDFIERFEKSRDVEDGALRGIIANSGKVSGRVKIIPSDYYFDFSVLDSMIKSMNDGDILVAETTSPELMPACKKASAIVTDQGGLLSHAAIVSREMKIPCLVAVDHATEILKDGDLVEVDANKGIVTIL